jgi:alcohol dehydrogenase YqhD (iron-dependent ADH family)
MFSEKVLLIVKNFKQILEDLVEDEDMTYMGFTTRLTLPFGGSRIDFNEVILQVSDSHDYSFTHMGERTTFKYSILHPKFEFELCKYFNSIEIKIFENNIEDRIRLNKGNYENQIQKSFCIKPDIVEETKPDEKKLRTKAQINATKKFLEAMVQKRLAEIKIKAEELLKERDEILKENSVITDKIEKYDVQKVITCGERRALEKQLNDLKIRSEKYKDELSKYNISIGGEI